MLPDALVASSRSSALPLFSRVALAGIVTVDVRRPCGAYRSLNGHHADRIRLRDDCPERASLPKGEAFRARAVFCVSVAGSDTFLLPWLYLMTLQWHAQCEGVIHCGGPALPSRMISTTSFTPIVHRACRRPMMAYSLAPSSFRGL